MDSTIQKDVVEKILVLMELSRAVKHRLGYLEVDQYRLEEPPIHYLDQLYIYFSNVVISLVLVVSFNLNARASCIGGRKFTKFLVNA